LPISSLECSILPRKLSSVADFLKQGRLQAASKAVKAILTKEPRNSSAHFYMAKIYLAENKHELALMELKAVSDIGQFEVDIPETEFRRLIAGLYERFNQLRGSPQRVYHALQERSGQRRLLL
jgi:thioredoxin-like negative regulator of GroEL